MLAHGCVMFLTQVLADKRIFKVVPFFKISQQRTVWNIVHIMRFGNIQLHSQGCVTF